MIAYESKNHFWLVLSILFACFLASPLSQAQDRRGQILVVIGAPGTEEYGASFRDWGARWKEGCNEWDFKMIDGTAKESKGIEDRQELLDWIAQPSTYSPRWLVLIGHGTSSQKVAKFNMRGPDVSSEQLAKSLDNSKGSWVIVNCTSCSGPFINALSKPDRIIVSATKSGSELNFARFGEYFSKAIIDGASDLDHDENVSVLEAFLAASKQVEEFYKGENRLASEHALLDDNGDKQGAAASFFRGVRPAKTPEKGKQLDGKAANRLSIATLNNAPPLSPEIARKREKIEQEIENLRQQKGELKEDVYYEKLEQLFLELAEALKL